ncbi:MAG: EutN/CcmL family microcompartment protein [Opitutales bacterium]
MRLGRVIGKVTLSVDDPAFSGARWLLVSPLERAELRAGPPYGISAASSLVAYDHLGAGMDDVVGYVEGAEATQPFERPTPVDAYIVCIVDNIQYQPPAEVRSVNGRPNGGDKLVATAVLK